MKKEITYKIGLYIRVSTEEQAENPDGSIRNQEERLRQTIKLKNMERHFGDIVEVYVDRARSGKDTNRPELQRMLQAIRNKEIDLVMATELSRISRSIKDFADIWELMQKHGCGFQSLRESFDTTTAAGEMVLYTMANIAQFERRQVSERVSANFTARAARGLFNGGSVAIGYKISEINRGHLEIDEEYADTIRMAFKAFLKEGTLAKACIWLNDNGYTLKRTVQGSGRMRAGYFLTETLHQILRNRSYIGIRVYRVKGEVKETKAMWPPLIDEATFIRAGELLDKNQYARIKPHSHKRYPYLLAGITTCSRCGNRMAGKSATGNGGKVPYYEHSWCTKRNSTLTKKIFQCNPTRIQAAKLEPLVWQETLKYLTKPEVAKALFKEAKLQIQSAKPTQDLDRLKSKITGYKGQLDALAERLGELPKGVSAEPIYKQMEKIENLKKDIESKLEHLNRQTFKNPTAVSEKTFEEFSKGLLKLLKDHENDALTKTFIIQKLIHRIQISPEGVEIEFHASQSHFEREIWLLEGDPAQPKAPETTKPLSKFSKGFAGQSLTNSGSQRLTIGGASPTIGNSPNLMKSLNSLSPIRLISSRN